MEALHAAADKADPLRAFGGKVSDAHAAHGAGTHGGEGAAVQNGLYLAIFPVVQNHQAREIGKSLFRILREFRQHLGADDGVEKAGHKHELVAVLFGDASVRHEIAAASVDGEGVLDGLEDFVEGYSLPHLGFVQYEHGNLLWGELTGMQRARLDSVPEKRDEHRLSESLYAVGHKRSKRCPEDIFTTKQSITLMPELSRILIELV